ncbi:MAG: hypothetical protein ACLQGJ_03495 [Candidatus Dormibacteria bacterium]
MPGGKKFGPGFRDLDCLYLPRCPAAHEGLDPNNVGGNLAAADQSRAIR